MTQEIARVTDWKMTVEIAGVDVAQLENDGPENDGRKNELLEIARLENDGSVYVTS